jgi:poly(3-hydroxyalkanoate) depolymerase
MCNGIGASLDALQPFVDALDALDGSIEVVRFDVPGVGGSPRAAFPYSLAGLARVARQLMRQLGHDRIDVLGLSWGGALAQQMALQYPRFVRRLILVGTSPGAVMVPGRPRVLARMLSARRFTDPAYAASVVGSLYGGTARTDPIGVLSVLGPGVVASSSTGCTHQVLAALGWTSLPWLPFIRQPTLIIAGSDDPIVPLANARILHWLIPRARLHVHSGGHVALITEAAGLAPVVAGFVTAG